MRIIIFATTLITVLAGCSSFCNDMTGQFAGYQDVKSVTGQTGWALAGITAGTCAVYAVGKEVVSLVSSDGVRPRPTFRKSDIRPADGPVKNSSAIFGCTPISSSVTTGGQ